RTGGRPVCMRPSVSRETATGSLITQRSQVRILSPLPAEMTPEVRPLGSFSCRLGTDLGTLVFADHPECSRIVLVVHAESSCSQRIKVATSLDRPQWAVFVH